MVSDGVGGVVNVREVMKQMDICRFVKEKNDKLEEENEKLKNINKMRGGIFPEEVKELEGHYESVCEENEKLKEEIEKLKKDIDKSISDWEEFWKLPEVAHHGENLGCELDREFIEYEHGSSPATFMGDTYIITIKQLQEWYNEEEKKVEELEDKILLLEDKILLLEADDED